MVHIMKWDSLVAQIVTHLLSMRETQVRSLDHDKPLENSMHGGYWWATVHWVTKSRAQLSDFTFTKSQGLKPKWALNSAGPPLLLSREAWNSAAWRLLPRPPVRAGGGGCGPFVLSLSVGRGTGLLTFPFSPILQMRKLKSSVGKQLTRSHTAKYKRAGHPQPLPIPRVLPPPPKGEGKQQAGWERKGGAPWKGRPCTLTSEGASGRLRCCGCPVNTPPLLILSSHLHFCWPQSSSFFVLS